MGHCKLIQSGSLVEFYEYQKSVIVRPRQGLEGVKRRRHFDVARREDSIRRSVKSFRRLVRSNFVADETPCLVTLTLLSPVSLATSRVFLREFFDRCRRAYGRQVRYIAVPEWQQRGVIHFHILMWGLPQELACLQKYKKYGKKKKAVHVCPAGAQCERHTRRLQRFWLRGFCDCIKTDGSFALVGYLSKYMSKAMRDDRLRDQRAYSSSGNVLRSVSVSSPTLVDYLGEIVGDDAVASHVHRFGTQWLGSCLYRSFDVDRGVDNS